MIDPNIAMGYRPVQIEPQSNALMRALGIQNAMTQNRAMQQQMAAQDRAIADQDRRRSIYQQGGDVIGNLKQAGYIEDALKLEEGQAKAAGSAMDLDLKRLQKQREQMEFGLRGLSRLNTVADAEGWLTQQVRDGLWDMKAATAELHKLQSNPASFGQWRDGLLKTGLTLAQQFDLGLRELEADERERHNRNTEQNQRRGQDLNYRGMVDAAATSAGKQNFERSDKLRDEHQRGSGNFVKIRDAYVGVQQAAAAPSAASDLALIFGFMKMLDPGSVVREGEFANAQNAAGVPDQIRNAYNRARTGERLNDKQRADFLGQAERIYQGAERSQSQFDDQYRGYARSFGVDPVNVITDYRIPKPGQRRPPAQPAGSPSIDDLVKKYGG